MINLELYYIVPLIVGWSGLADHPLNAYARMNKTASVILEYNKSDTPHVGEIIEETDLRKFVKCDIDPKYLKDYKLILNGEYSRVSNSTKNIIISRAATPAIRFHVDSVLFKSKKLKKKLEENLGVDDIDELTDEYESLIFKTKPIYDEKSVEIQ
jgi:hypothetical protein